MMAQSNSKRPRLDNTDDDDRSSSKRVIGIDELLSRRRGSGSDSDSKPAVVVMVPTYQQPKYLLPFSFDHHRQLHLDDSELRYYHKVPLDRPDIVSSVNITRGFDRFVARDDSVDEHLDALLQCFCKYAEELYVGRVYPKPDIFTWRGLLTTLLVTPFHRSEPWEIGVTILRGTYFMELRKSEEDQQEASRRNDNNAHVCSYGGYKFEQYMTSRHRDYDRYLRELPQRVEEPVNSNAAFGICFRSKLNDKTIFAGADVDCMDPSAAPSSPSSSSGGGSSSRFVELKTCRTMDSAYLSERYHNDNLLKFWAQSFLAGVPKVVVGYRSTKGDIQSIRELETLRIPSVAKEHQGKWDANVCMSFADGLLDWIRGLPLKESPTSSYIVRYRPDVGIAVDLEERGHGFLPSRFIQFYQQYYGDGSGSGSAVSNVT